MDLFTKHPRSVGETYLEHNAAALGFAGGCFSAACMAFVHAFFPFLYERGASTTIKRLNDKLQERFSR